MQETQEMQVQFLGWEDVFLPGESHGQMAIAYWASKSQTRLSAHTHKYILKHLGGNHVVR